MTPIDGLAFAQQCAGNIDWALEQLDRVDSEKSLRAYVRAMWSILEPTRRLVEGWCLHAICDHLQAITDGHIRDLVVSVPPGCMKSLSASVFWPTHEWGPKSRPQRRYLFASYSTDLTHRDNRKARRLMESPKYQRLWGDRFRFSSDANRVERIENDKSGFRLATSVSGAGMGERIDVAVVDDPLKGSDGDSPTKVEAALRWFSETLSTRGTDPGSMSRVVIMQRLNERDIAGHAMSKELGFERLVLPMRHEVVHPHTRKRTLIGFEDPRRHEGELLWPERFPEEEVRRLELELGSHGTASQLQQRPTPRGGGMFKTSWFHVVDEPGNDGMVVRGWDLAASTTTSSPFTAGVKMRKTVAGRLIVEDVVRIRGDAYEVEQLILNTAIRDGKDVAISIPQDPGQSGKTQVVAFSRLLHGFNVHYSPESGSKESRADPLAGQAGGGNLAIVRAAWNDAFVAEAIVFPGSTWKDQVDAASRAYAHLLTARPPRERVFFAPTFGELD